MFDSLEETIRHDVETSRAERIIRITVVFLISMFIFSGLYFAIKMLE